MCGHNCTSADTVGHAASREWPALRARQPVPFTPPLLFHPARPPLPVQSFSKNMGLYGERVGCLTLLTTDAAAARGALDLLHDVG